MQNNPENNVAKCSPKTKYLEESFIKNEIYNSEINYINNNNNFSNMGTTNLPTDFNIFTDLDYLEQDFNINNKKLTSQKLNEDKKNLLDNTFDNVKVNLIEEINQSYNVNSEDFGIHKKYESLKECDNSIFSYSQTYFNIPLEIYKRNQFAKRGIRDFSNNYNRKNNFLKKKVKKG